MYANMGFIFVLFPVWDEEYWSGHISNDMAHNDRTVEEGDSNNVQTNDDPTEPTIDEIDRGALSGIEEIYGRAQVISSTFQPEVLQKFSEFIGDNYATCNNR